MVTKSNVINRELWLPSGIPRMRFQRSDGRAGKGQVNWEWKGAHPPSWQGSRRGMGERRRKRGQAGRPARFMDLLGKAQRVGQVEQGPKSKRERKESSATVANLPDPWHPHRMTASGPGQRCPHHSANTTEKGKVLGPKRAISLKNLTLLSYEVG